MLAGLPQETEQALAQLTSDLALPPAALEALCHGLLLDMIGWASWCRGIDWRAENQGGTSKICRELLAVLLAWEWAGFALADNATTTGTSQGDNVQRSRTNQQELVRQAVRGAKYGSLSTFTLVETTGLAWAWKLVRDSLNKGNGNKLLHSVIGGNVGVIEGDGSDLRIGLPWQTVHDGKNWRHEPMRLTVLIDAPQERIDLALERTPALATLVKNQWLSMTSLQLIKRTRGASSASAQLTVAG